MKIKKKVVFLTLDITLVGGVERMLSTLLPFFIKMNDFDVEIISIFNSKSNNYFNFQNIKISFLSNVNFDISTKFNSLKTYLILINKLILLSKKNDTIYVSTFPNISILFLLFKGSKNLIISEHAQFNAHNGFINRFRKLIYKTAKKITLLTVEQYNIFNKFCLSERLFIIPNPINQTILSLNRRSDSIITVGRLVPEKGYDIFIEALKCIKITKPNFKAIILGSGPEINNLLNLIFKYDLKDNVEIIENETDVFKYLSKSTVFVVTSYTESFGLAMLESLSIGIPVVAFDAGDGPKSLINDSYNGYLVPFGDIKQLEKKILNVFNLSEDEWSVLSNNAIKSSEQYYVQNIYTKWKLLINQ
jgi:glycosyltransferase involved in cell wall biosynthesis